MPYQIPEPPSADQSLPYHRGTRISPGLYVEDRGVGEPLLAITGFAVSSAALDPLAEVYASRLRWITYDNPGCGRSSRRAFACTTGQLAAAAIRVLDELEVDAAHVAGLSLGGAIAQEVAIRFPDRVRGLILMSTSTCGPLSFPPDPRALVALSGRTAAGSLRRRRPWLGPSFFSPEFLREQPERADALLRPMTEYPSAPWSIAGQVIAAGLHDRGVDLHRIQAPTLVVHGDRDVLVPVANARFLADGIPDAELHVVAGGRHGAAVEHAEAVRDLICDWLERRRPPAGEPLESPMPRAEWLTRVPRSLGALARRWP
jgi:pimeloyl-ACP methyl ester carboxylesterase